MALPNAAKWVLLVKSLKMAQRMAFDRGHPVVQQYNIYEQHRLKHSFFQRGNEIYRVSQEECARLREGVPYVKVCRYNPKHLYPKLKGYGDNGQRKVWSSCGPTYCTCYADAFPYTVHVLESGMQCNSIVLDINVPCKVLGTLRITTALVRVFMLFNLMALCHSYTLSGK
jgi:hypothetical protein